MIRPHSPDELLNDATGQKKITRGRRSCRRCLEERNTEYCWQDKAPSPPCRVSETSGGMGGCRPHRHGAVRGWPGTCRCSISMPKNMVFISITIGRSPVSLNLLSFHWLRCPQKNQQQHHHRTCIVSCFLLLTFFIQNCQFDLHAIYNAYNIFTQQRTAERTQLVGPSGTRATLSTSRTPASSSGPSTPCAGFSTPWIRWTPCSTICSSSIKP